MNKVTSLKALSPNDGHQFDIAGAHLSFKVRTADTNNAFCMFEQTLQPGEGVPVHRHSYTEAFYVLAGVLTFDTVEATGLDYGVGSTVIATPEVVHAFRNAGTEPVRLLSVAGAGHQNFFDRVEREDAARPFATMAAQEAAARVGHIGAQTDTRFVMPTD